MDIETYGCIADDVSSYIIFSNRHEIRRLELDQKQQSYVSLVSGLRNTIALDFYYNQSTGNGDGSWVFWTDVVDDKIYKGMMISNCECIRPFVHLQS